jgi:hypothetical protein
MRRIFRVQKCPQVLGPLRGRLGRPSQAYRHSSLPEAGGLDHGPTPQGALDILEELAIDWFALAGRSVSSTHCPFHRAVRRLGLDPVSSQLGRGIEAKRPEPTLPWARRPVSAGYRRGFTNHMTRIRNGFWFAHAAYSSEVQPAPITFHRN